MREIRSNGRRRIPGTVLMVLTGAAVGATAALLVAPRSGRETRQRIKAFARKTGEKATRIPTALSAACGRGSNEARRAFSEALHE